MRKSKRELERSIEQLRDGDGPGDVDVVSSVVTVTEGEDGPEEPESEPAPPEGYELGPEIGDPSDVVSVHALTPTDAVDGEG